MKLQASWYKELQEEISKPYIKNLKEFLFQERSKGVEVYPPEDLIFNAFRHTPFDAVKVIIIGQDPYHGSGQAHGLSFSVPEGVHPPPSLKNIFKEVESDLNIRLPPGGDLSGWASQGVLLLNATLTVRAREPKSHYNVGWEQFTDVVVEKLLGRAVPLVFLLWGKSAQEKLNSILEKKRDCHLILKGAHPSPYSAHSGFFGCRHFSKANAHLIQWGKEPIDWGKK